MHQTLPLLPPSSPLTPPPQSPGSIESAVSTVPRPPKWRAAESREQVPGLDAEPARCAVTESDCALPAIILVTIQRRSFPSGELDAHLFTGLTFPSLGTIIPRSSRGPWHRSPKCQIQSLVIVPAEWTSCPRTTRSCICPLHEDSSHRDSHSLGQR